MVQRMGHTEVINKVFRSQFDNVEPEGMDRWSIRLGSTRVYIQVRETESFIIINLFAPVLTGVRDTEELYQWVALHANDYVFGHVHLERWDDGTLVIGLTHRLLGDFLDEAEIYYAVKGLGESADDLDDGLQPRFGGSRLHED